MRISDWSSDVCSSDLISADRGSSLTSVAARSAQMRLNPCMVGIWRQILSIYDCFPMGCFTSEISSHMVEKTLRCSVICGLSTLQRSEEHTSELQSLMRISSAVFCLNKQHPRLQTYANNLYI